MMSAGTRREGKKKEKKLKSEAKGIAGYLIIGWGSRK
jgi:hypothetical protein